MTQKYFSDKVHSSFTMTEGQDEIGDRKIYSFFTNLPIVEMSSDRLEGGLLELNASVSLNILKGSFCS